MREQSKTLLLGGFVDKKKNIYIYRTLPALYFKIPSNLSYTAVNVISKCEETHCICK